MNNKIMSILDLLRPRRVELTNDEYIRLYGKNKTQDTNPSVYLIGQDEMFYGPKREKPVQKQAVSTVERTHPFNNEKLIIKSPTANRQVSTVERAYPFEPIIQASTTAPVIELPDAIIEAPIKTFGQAFAEARNNGVDVFEWKGKKYTTETAGDKKDKAERQKKDKMLYRPEVRIAMVDVPNVRVQHPGRKVMDNPIVI